MIFCQSIARVEKLRSLQKQIIGAVYSEFAYDKVSFLQPVDFDKELRPLWEKLLMTQGEIRKILEVGMEHPEITKYAYMVNYTYVDILAFMMLEMRFRQYFEFALNDLKRRNLKDVYKTAVINDAFEDSKDIDVFDAIDLTPGYLGELVNVEQLIKLKNYVNKRCNGIKGLRQYK